MRAQDEHTADQPPAGQGPGWRLRQTAIDTYERSRVGGFLYLFGWAVISLMGELLEFAPALTFLLGLSFLFLAMLRVRLRPPMAGIDALKRWFRHYAIVLPLPSLLWGLVQAWILTDARFELPLRMVSLIATIGYATVFAHVYATVRSHAVVGICVLLLPPLATLLTDPEMSSLALAVSLYAAYLVAALMRSHADYHRRLGLDQALREQRDLYEQLSRTDPLTGVHNRRHFTDRLEQASQAAERGKGLLTLLLLDVDHFKLVNDRHGHAIGDACLKGLAERMQRVFAGEGMLLARLGGEEFGVLFEQSDQARALAAADAFRRDLVQTPLVCGGRRLEITVSIGVGGFDPARHGDGDGLYRAVDRALYAAKTKGRDRVQTASEAGA